MKDSIQAEETLGNVFNFQSTRCQLGSYNIWERILLLSKWYIEKLQVGQ